MNKFTEKLKARWDRLIDLAMNQKGAKSEISIILLTLLLTVFFMGAMYAIYLLIAFGQWLGNGSWWPLWVAIGLSLVGLFTIITNPEKEEDE